MLHFHRKFSSGIIPSFSSSSAPCSTEAPSTYTIRRDTYRCRHSPKDVLLTSARVLSVRRGQSSYERLPPLPRCPKVNCGAEREIDWRLNGSEGCGRGRGSLLNPRREFCLAWLVKSAPQSLLVNRFAVLDIEEVNTDICKPIDAPFLSPSAPCRIAQPWRSKWERRLLSQMVTYYLWWMLWYFK